MTIDIVRVIPYYIAVGRFSVIDISDKMIDICSDLFDKLTVVKGFMQLSNENKRKKVDYSLIVIQEVSNIERSLINLCDLINENRTDQRVVVETNKGKGHEVAVEGQDTLEVTIAGDEVGMSGEGTPDVKL